jgi:hypothetical protein
MSQKSSFPHPTDSVQYVLTSNTLGWQRTARDVTDKKAAEPTQWVIVDPAPLDESEAF